MAQFAWPFDAGAGANITEGQWRNMARHWLATGVLAGEDLELAVFADSTGMQVKARTGKAWIRGHYYENDAEVVLPIAAAHATLTRVDRVVLRADFTANTIALAVVTGVAGAAATALVQSTAMWEIGLAQVSVPALDASIDAGQVTDERSLIGNVSRLGNGTAAAPSLAFASDPDTGLFRSAADTVAITTGGVIKATVDAAGGVTISRPTAGTSLTISKDTNTIDAGSIRIARPATTVPQSLVFSFGTASDYVIGRSASTDHLQLGINAGGGFIEQVRFETSGTIRAIGTSHLFGSAALGANGIATQLTEAFGTSAVVQPSSPNLANVNALLSSKGTGEVQLLTRGLTDVGVRIGSTGAAPTLAFYNTAPIAKQTAVAVTAAGIHAALTALGLIT